VPAEGADQVSETVEMVDALAISPMTWPGIALSVAAVVAMTTLDDGPASAVFTAKLQTDKYHQAEDS
jgi:hypothetical protein